MRACALTDVCVCMQAHVQGAVPGRLSLGFCPALAPSALVGNAACPPPHIKQQGLTHTIRSGLDCCPCLCMPAIARPVPTCAHGPEQCSGRCRTHMCCAHHRHCLLLSTKGYLDHLRKSRCCARGLPPQGLSVTAAVHSSSPYPGSLRRWPASLSLRRAPPLLRVTASYLKPHPHPHHLQHHPLHKRLRPPRPRAPVCPCAAPPTAHSHGWPHAARARRT